MPKCTYRFATQKKISFVEITDKEDQSVYATPPSKEDELITGDKIFLTTIYKRAETHCQCQVLLQMKADANH
jgi:hypothetical protein